MNKSNDSKQGSLNESSSSRFTAQASTAEDLVKSQTVGLVQLSDFRKRRAEAFDHTDQDLSIATSSRFAPSSVPSGAVPLSTTSDGTLTPNHPRPKKKKKTVQKTRLTFASDDDESEDSSIAKADAGKQDQSLSKADSSRETPPVAAGDPVPPSQRRLGHNSSLAMAPQVMTKSALRKAAEAREELKKEFLVMQEAVKATEIVIPFVFYDGTNIPGGACKIKKGEHVWLFLDRSRKVGAELGIGGSEKGSSKREWARISVDDLMLVRGDIIIPQHFDIYYFIVNKVKAPNGRVLFDFASTIESSRIPSATDTLDNDYNPLSDPGQSKARHNGSLTAADGDLEGSKDDPTFTKVVDRRWYERNKHLFPASIWQEYDAGKDYTNDVRKDSQGNAFFF